MQHPGAFPFPSGAQANGQPAHATVVLDQPAAPLFPRRRVGRIELVGEVTIIGPWVRVRCPITPGDNEGEGIQEFCLPQAHIIGILATPHPRDGADPGSVHTEQAPVTESSRDPDTGEPLSDDAFDEYLWAILDQAPGRDRRPSMAISPAETEVIARLLDDLVDHHGTAPIGGTAREMAARLRSRLPKK